MKKLLLSASLVPVLVGSIPTALVSGSIDWFSDIREINKGKAINKLGANGNSLVHNWAMVCADGKKYSEIEEAIQGNEDFESFFNPFIENKAGHTPRQLALISAKKTGSISCKYLSYNFEALEKNFFEQIFKAMKNEAIAQGEADSK